MKRIVCVAFFEIKCNGNYFLKLRYCDLRGIDVYALLLQCRRVNCDHFPIVYCLFCVIRLSFSILKIFLHIFLITLFAA